MAKPVLSITEGGKRVATLELGGPKQKTQRWSMRQLKGPRNSAVRPVVESMARLYSEIIRSRPTGKETPA